MYEELEIYDKKGEQKTLREWENRVDTMDIFSMKSTYNLSKETNKYNRFTGFLKEWVCDALSGSGYRIPKIEGMCNKGLLVVTFAGNKFPKDWWDIALKVGKGQKVENTLPSLSNLKENTFGEVDLKEKKENIYATFMPAYRALKESFDRRWGFISWVFNHNQYTAERDSLAALSGLMMSLTGDTQQDIDKVLADYKKAMPETGRTQKERKEEVAQIRNEAKGRRTSEENGREEEPIKEEPIEAAVKDDPNRNPVAVELDDDEKSVNIELAIEDNDEPNKSIDSINPAR